LKAGKGKLNAPDGVIDAQIASLGIIPLPIGLSHIRALTALDTVEGHKDPFDRLIAAQAITEQLPLVTTDKAFRKYRNVVVIW
jgi:PIN domain nuclease of toxin-antitoxin system